VLTTAIRTTKGGPGFVVTASAQMKTEPSAQPKATEQKPAPTDQKMGQKVEGTVKKPGAHISAEYEERGGQKIATSLQIKG